MKSGKLGYYLLFCLLAISCTQETDNSQKIPRLKHYKETNMNKDKKRFTVLEDGSIIHYMQVSKETADSIIQSQKAPLIKKGKNDDSLFQLQDGSVLLTQEGYGASHFIYKNPDDLKRIEESTDAFY